ncbi:MAG: ABC transporter permease [archaeon]
MIKDFFNLALGNLKHRGLRSWLTMLGIFIGIAAVVSLISLGNGLEQAVTGQFSSLSTDKLTIMNAETGFGPPGSTAVTKLTEHDNKIVESTQGVSFTIPRLLRVVRVDYNRVQAYKYLVSMPADEKKVSFIYQTFGIKTATGIFLRGSDRGKVLLGSDIADKNSFGKPIESGDNLVINGKSFEVVGVLEKASSFQINQAIMINEEDMKNLLSIRDEYDILIAQVDSADIIKQVAEDITTRMRKDRGLKEGEEDFVVQTPAQALSAVNTILTIINLVVAGIASISLLVGGIGISNTMFTSILERTKEIGTMKAVGARNKDILSIFLFESGLLGLVGGIVGAILGLSLAFLAALIANTAFGSTILSVQVSYPLLSAAILFSFIIGVVSGIIPAIQASRLRPVEALRA